MRAEKITVNILTHHIMGGKRRYHRSQSPLAYALREVGYNEVITRRVDAIVDGYHYDIDPGGIDWLRRFNQGEPVAEVEITLIMSHKPVYKHVESLQQAQAHPDGIVRIASLMPDDYVVVQAALVGCSEEMLWQLSFDLHAVAWPRTPRCSIPELTYVAYGRFPVGAEISTGRRDLRVWVPSDIWINPKFIEKGLETDIRAVIHGRQDRIRQLNEHQNCR